MSVLIAQYNVINSGFAFLSGFSWHANSALTTILQLLVLCNHRNRPLGLLKVQGPQKYYRNIKEVDGIVFEIREGEIFGITRETVLVVYMGNRFTPCVAQPTAVKSSISLSTEPIPSIPKFSTITLATSGDRKPGSVGPNLMFFTPR